MGLTKRKDSFYVEFRVLDDGKVLRLAPPGQGKLRRWKVGTRETRIARTQEAVIKTGLLAGTIPSPSVERPVLFEEWVETYLALPEVTGLRSYRRVQQVLRVSWGSRFRGRAVQDLKADDIEAFRREHVNAGLKPGSINHQHAILKRCLTVARRRGVIPTNPAGDVTMPDPNNARSRVLTPEEFSTLFQALSVEDRLVFLLGYDCGMRQGEILNLEWTQISLQDRMIVLQSEQTKTKTARTVPMTERVVASFQYLPRNTETTKVFMDAWRFPYRFTKAVKRLQIPDFTFHDTRHCARTNLRRAGVDTSVAMKWLGHKSEMMSRRYDAIETQDLYAGVEKLNQRINGAGGVVDDTPRPNVAILRVDGDCEIVGKNPTPRQNQNQIEGEA